MGNRVWGILTVIVLLGGAASFSGCLERAERGTAADLGEGRCPKDKESLYLHVNTEAPVYAFHEDIYANVLIVNPSNENRSIKIVGYHIEVYRLGGGNLIRTHSSGTDLDGNEGEVVPANAYLTFSPHLMVDAPVATGLVREGPPGDFLYRLELRYLDLSSPATEAPVVACGRTYYRITR